MALLFHKKHHKSGFGRGIIIILLHIIIIIIVTVKCNSVPLNNLNNYNNVNNAINRTSTILDFSHATNRTALTLSPHPVMLSSQILTSSQSRDRRSAKDIRKTAYICENGTLELSCQAQSSGGGPEQRIDVLRANFGRFSITLCNPSGQLDWSVNCASSNSLAVLIERCSNKVQCSVPASSELFGDPCPSTSKYLEVHYRCSSGQISTKSPESSSSLNRSPVQSGTPFQPIPPRLPPSHHHQQQQQQTALFPPPPPPPLISSPSLPSNVPVDGPSTKSGRPTSQSNKPNIDTPSNPFSIGSGSTSTNQDLLPHFNQPNADTNNINIHGANNSVSLPTSGSGSNYLSTWHDSTTTNHANLGHDGTKSQSGDDCLSVIYRHIQWPTTLGGDTFMTPCPESTSGLAKWTCLGPKWHALPDLSQCTAPWLHQLVEMKNTRQMQRTDIWKSILTRAERSSTLFGGDVIALTELLRDSLADTIQYESSSSPSVGFIRTPILSHQSQHLVALETVFELISFLLERDTTPAWLDLPIDVRERTINSLLESIVDFSVMNCLDSRHFYSERQLIRQSKFQLISCLSLARTFYELQSTLTTTTNSKMSTTVRDNNQRLAFELFNSRPFTHLLPFTNVSVVMSGRMDHLQTMVNENRFVGVLLAENVGQYFSVNDRRTLELNVDESFLRMVSLSSGSASDNMEDEQFGDNVEQIGMQFINSNVIRLFEFNQTHLLTAASRHTDGNTNNANNNNNQHASTKTGTDSPNSSTGSMFDPNDSVEFEIHFQHWIESEALQHECIHFGSDTDRNTWSSEHCFVIQTNATHTVCRCRRILSTIALLASQNGQNVDNHQNKHLHFGQHSKASLLKSQSWFQKRPGGSVIGLVLLSISWIGLVFARWQNGFVARFSMIPLLLVCIVRTCIEVLLIAGPGHQQWLLLPKSDSVEPLAMPSSSSSVKSSSEWQSLTEFVCLYQMGVISSLLSVFICQNVILVALSARIFLARNYSAVVQTLNKSKRIQIFISFTFPLIYFGCVTLFSQQNQNYVSHRHRTQSGDGLFAGENFKATDGPDTDRRTRPSPGKHQILWLSRLDSGTPFGVALVLEPFIQILLNILASIVFVQCCQKFAHYGYPNLHTFRYDISEIESHVKNLFCHRCKYLTIWSLASVIYVLLFVVSLTIGMAYQELSWVLFTFDIGFLLSLSLLIQPDRLQTLLSKIKPANKSLSSGVVSIGESSSISVVSDSNKSFLSTFPGQMARMLESPKIYPNSTIIGRGAEASIGPGIVNAGGQHSHQSSSSPSYESGSDPSSHLYESPKNLFATKLQTDLYGRRRRESDDTNIGFHTARLHGNRRSSKNASSNYQQHGLFTLRDNLSGRPMASQYTPAYGYTSIDNELHPDLCPVVNYHTARLSRPTAHDLYYAYDRDPYSSQD